jgi:VCBS repeat-containing protein
VLANGSWEFTANAAFDLLQVGDSASESFTFTVTDGLGHSDTQTLTLDIFGGDDAPVITFADTPGTVAEDLAPSIAVNGGFENGDLTGWTGDTHVNVLFLGLGGEFGDYAAHLGATAPLDTESLTQNVATTPGEHYTLSFTIIGDPEATSNSLTATWGGASQITVVDNFGGFTTYTFDVIGGAGAFTTLQFTYSDDGVGMYIDQVTVSPASAAATASDDGTIGFTDIDTPDTHTATFVPQGLDYVGTFTLDPIVESGGSGTVAWHFDVDNAAIQFLAQGQTLTQIYTVSITGLQGGSVQQDIAIAISGSNDAPSAVADSIITNVAAPGPVLIPGWALGWNDTDPDTTDILSVADATGIGDDAAFASGGFVQFFDGGTEGGEFTYTAFDGIVAGTSATATVANVAPATSLTGTGNDDIIIAGTGSGESGTIDGGDGSDILIGGVGAESLTGGSGDDLFAFLQPSADLATSLDDMDAITDFDVTGDDLLAFSASGFGGGLTAGMDASIVFESSSDATFLSSFNRFHLDTSSQILYYSADGTTDSAVAVLQLQPSVTLNPQQDLYIVA